MITLQNKFPRVFQKTNSVLIQVYRINTTCRSMSSQFRKCWLQLLLNLRTNHFLQYQQPVTFLNRANVSKRELSSLCALPDTKIEEQENSDEFNEAYILDFPTDVPTEVQPLIRKVMLEIETNSLFHYRPTPKHLSSEDWLRLLECDTYAERKKLCSYFYWREKRREVNRKQAKNKREMLVFREKKHVPIQSTFTTSDVVPRGAAYNSIFNAIHTLKYMERVQDLQVLKAVIFGPHVIIDCGYESYMRNSELNSCARQLMMTRNSNRTFKCPFNIIHSNMDVNGVLMKRIHTFLPNVYDPANTFHYTEKSFLELFPAEKLVYLSPHADVELKTYDPDSVYIVGALVDHTPKIGLSSEKAHLSGIRTAKFPLEKYSNWCQGSKCLMLFQAVTILDDLKEGFSWDEILLKRIQPQKTTFSSLSWGKPGFHHEPLSTRYIDCTQFIEHNIGCKIKENEQ